MPAVHRFSPAREHYVEDFPELPSRLHWRIYSGMGRHKPLSIRPCPVCKVAMVQSDIGWNCPACALAIIDSVEVNVERRRPVKQGALTAELPPTP